jgi:hypothetical protein
MNYWLDHSVNLISEIDNYRQQKGIDSPRSTKKIVQVSLLLCHYAIINEAYGHVLLNDISEIECICLEIKLREEFPKVFERIKTEERFQDIVNLLEPSKKAYIAYSFYRNQYSITGYTMETLRKYHLASNGVAHPLKSIIKSIDRDKTLYLIAPTILSYLQPIYEQGFQNMIESRIAFDRSRNESRVKVNSYQNSDLDDPDID